MTNDATELKPLWLLIEEKILEFGPQAFEGDNGEPSMMQMAQDLDKSGHNVSQHGGNLLRLRWAVKDMLGVGKPLMQDFNDAVAAFKLEDVMDPYRAAVKLIADVGQTWPSLRDSERKPDIVKIIDARKLDLLVAKAKELSGDEGIRLLILENVAAETVIAVLGIDQGKFDEVNAAVEAERAERERVKGLIEAAGEKPAEELVKDLINNNVAAVLIVEMAGVEQSIVDGVNKAMEEELAEKKRLEEEAAAAKAAEAAGPPLEDIPDDEMVDYIENLREILEFSDQEKEIRAMCEQSAIPLCLVDIAVSEPDKLDALEEKAGG